MLLNEQQSPLKGNQSLFSFMDAQDESKDGSQRSTSDESLSQCTPATIPKVPSFSKSSESEFHTQTTLEKKATPEWNILQTIEFACEDPYDATAPLDAPYFDTPKTEHQTAPPQ